jgi:hypothetical protein
MPYRDERKALNDRHDDLARQIASIERDAESFRTAVHQADALRRELADVDTRIAKLAGSRVLPILEDVRVASPCHEPWDAMVGDDRVRFCGSCKKNVYNLSTMRRDEAEALLAEREGKMCVRFFRRADGTVLTADCPVGQKKRRRRLALVVAGASALATAALAWVGLEPTDGAGMHLFGEKVAVQGGATSPPIQPPPVPMMGTPVPRAPNHVDVEPRGGFVHGHVSPPRQTRQRTGI